MQKLSGKAVLITGGNSGIGLASARLFLEHGTRGRSSANGSANLDVLFVNVGSSLSLR
jgi:NAD(P)-dependent dehydrogenase (short-subunit alcohol dehydrogenase family)